jgi:uracil-DNA glycosylase
LFRNEGSSKWHQAVLPAFGFRAEKSGGKITDYLTEPSWIESLAKEFNQPYFQEICSFLDREMQRGAQIFPPQQQIFTAFNLTPFSSVKVVILGQDPYHDDGQAMGLSFSVPAGFKNPPSLV